VLELAGIDSQQGGASPAPTRAYWHAVGGVRVQVKDTDAEKAREILRSAEESKRKASRPEEADDDLGGVRCPECSSKRVRRERFFRGLAFLSILFFWFPIPWPRRRFVCLDCGCRWKP